MKGKQSAFVPRHQIVGVTRFGQSQKKIIAGIVGASYGGEWNHAQGEFPNLVDQAAGLFDEF